MKCQSSLILFHSWMNPMKSLLVLFSIPRVGSISSLDDVSRSFWTYRFWLISRTCKSDVSITPLCGHKGFLVLFYSESFETMSLQYLDCSITDIWVVQAIKRFFLICLLIIAIKMKHLCWNFIDSPILLIITTYQITGNIINWNIFVVIN